jgi:hypothetical protein
MVCVPSLNLLAAISVYPVIAFFNVALTTLPSTTNWGVVPLMTVLTCTWILELDVTDTPLPFSISPMTSGRIVGVITVVFVLMPFHPENRQLLSEFTATMPANIANPNEIERDFLLFSTCTRCHWMTLRILYSYKWGTRSLVKKCDVVHTFWPFLGETWMICRQA